MDNIEMDNKLIFNVFGSKSSIDCDVMVVVNDDFVKNKYDNHCKKILPQLETQIKTNKPININFCKLNVNDNDNSVTLSWTHMGNPDECNNSLFQTYQNHIDLQCQKMFVTKLLPRNVGMKIVRCCRFMISLLSRTTHTEEVNSALKKYFLRFRLEVLKKMEYDKVLFEGKQRYTPQKIFKLIAFQIAQTSTLIKGVEIYSKEEACEHFPLLRCFLLRQSYTDNDLIELSKAKNYLCEQIELKLMDDPKIAELLEHSIE